MKDCACVSRKGLTAINDFSVKCKEKYPVYIIPIHAFDDNARQYVHKRCRKAHTNTRRYEQMRKRKYDCDSSQPLRSAVSKFCFHINCYLCGEWVVQEKIKRHPNNNYYEFSRVLLLQVKATITKRCAERRAGKVDEWADAVPLRLSCINNLSAEEAILHRRCYQYFMSPRNLKLDAPSTTTGGTVPMKRGRPSGAVDQEQKPTFMHVIEYLENNDDATVTLDELHEIMEKEAVVVKCNPQDHSSDSSMRTVARSTSQYSHVFNVLYEQMIYN